MEYTGTTETTESTKSNEFFRRVRLAGHPHARPESMVLRGGARFTVLTARLLRLEWSPIGEFTDDATFAFPNRHAESAPAFTVREDGVRLWIETAALTLSYRLGGGAFTAENLAITLHVGDETRTWRPGQPNLGNLGGTRRTLDFTAGDAPLEPGLVSREGWALFDDSAGVVMRPDDGWVAARAPRSIQDWYFFGYGHAYADALADYTQFGGAVPLIPRYALGSWWSRFWPYSAADLTQLVADFADHAIPLDVLVVDMDWHLPGYWTGYTWNRDLFPDPEAFLAAMHARGLRVTLNLHPADGIRPHEAAYHEFAAALGMGATPTASAAADTSGAQATPDAPITFRIADRQFAERYFALLHHPLEDQGVDFWWIDWQQGESAEVAGLDPLIWLNHLHFADARRRGQRPLIFSRWGGLGNHRYPIGFSGDTYGGWGTLAALPHFTATAANVGFGWWSHDIGGHFGAVDAELMTRWAQFGALSPCLRLHASKHDLAERRPWAFTAQARDAMRDAFELRAALVPYLYTMARQTHDRGLALCRPMYYAYPEHDAAYLTHGQYRLGDDLLAAPITDPADPHTGLAVKDVWIPSGTWYRFDTGERFVGPRWVRVTGDLSAIPLFARAGAIIPLATPALHLSETPNDQLDLRVFPGDAGAFRLYEDDGLSEVYLDGACEWTTLSQTTEAPESSGASMRSVMRIGPVEGDCPALPTTRGYSMTFVGAKRPVSVVDERGEPLMWSFASEKHEMRVTLPQRSKREATTVAVTWPAASADDAAGVAGAADVDRAHIVDTPPFIHLIAPTVGDEALREPARLVVVPPYTPDQQPRACDVELLWRETLPTGETEISQRLLHLAADTIMAAPFTLDASLQPRHWDVTARFLADDGTEVAAMSASGSYANPPIQRWRVQYAGEDATSVLQADVATRLTITDPYEARLEPGRASLAEASASLRLAEATTLWLDAWTNGGLSLELDGEPLGAGVPQPTLLGQTRQWPVTRYGPLTLPAGKHVVTLRLTAPAAAAPSWVFGALLVDATGAPVVRCATERGDSMAH